MEGKKEVAWNQYEDVIKPHLSRDTLHSMYARWANSYDQVSSTGVCSSVHHKQQNCEKCMNLCTMSTIQCNCVFKFLSLKLFWGNLPRENNDDDKNDKKRQTMITFADYEFCHISQI